MSPLPLKRLLREPLVHFVLIGTAIFAVYSLARGDGARRENQLVVSAAKIEHLAAIFQRTRQRPPTRGELEGLVDDFVREEAAYREGAAMGLDRDDTIVRRRIRQKLDFIAEDIAGLTAPTDEDLSAYLAAHPEDFRVEPRLSFRQVFVDPDAHEDADATVADLLRTLAGDPAIDWSELGDRIMLEPAYADLYVRDIAGLFGPQFSAAIADLEPGGWHGPIASGYGLHLVFIDERDDGVLPELDEVRAAVRREWEHARREETVRRFYEQILSRYEIVVQWPEAPAPEPGS